MYELPDHISALNTLAPSPSSYSMDQSAEDAVWNYLNTEELFRNFGVAPNDLVEKKEATPPLELAPSAGASTSTVPSTETTKKDNKPTDLKSFIEQFALENQGFAGSDLALGLGYTGAPTPATGFSGLENLPTFDIASTSPWEGSNEDERPSGAKKLKQAGAGQVEIEEDKRRRNTEASARFRAKKKEREQNLERRAKELEGQVAQLSAEKASLENENKLLKAIVLGGNAGSTSNASAELAQLMGKRKREE